MTRIAIGITKQNEKTKETENRIERGKENRGIDEKIVKKMNDIKLLVDY